MPLTKITVTEKFLDHLLEDARERESNAGFSGAHNDGGAAHIRELVCAFRAGRDGKIPAFWIDKIQKMQRDADEELQLFIRLKAKYEGKV